MQSLHTFLRNERGSVAVVFTLALVPLIGAAGAALDYSRATGSRASLQTAADAAALAAVRVKTLNATERQNTGKAMFNANKPDHLVANPDVEATSKEAVVKASASVPTSLMRVLNVNTMEVGVKAKAVKVFEGPPPCVFALSKDKSPAIEITGSAVFEGKNCALHANSSATGAVSITGSAKVKADGYCAVGTVTYTVSLTPQPESYCDELPDPYANLPVPENTACPKPALSTKSPLKPGVYCGGLSIKDDTVFEPGLYIIKDGDLKLNAQNSLTGKGVTFYLMGNTGFDINGGAKFELSAMDTGPYAGLAVVYDRNATVKQPNKLNGNSTTILVGGIYSPNQDLVLNGTGGFGQGSPYMPIIVSTVKISGNNTTTVEVDHTKFPGAKPLPKLASSVRLVE
ncbi:MAG TPA: pilus assembly protein TadG-related protein [Microvirga sp.]